MQTSGLIPVQELCVHHNIEQSFIYSLKEAGLIEIIREEEMICIPLDQLPHLEKLIRLYEMDINLEGIETITHLLDRIEQLQSEMTILKNRLRLYEDL